MSKLQSIFESLRYRCSIVLCIICAMLCMHGEAAYSATWQWESFANGEAVTITASAPLRGAKVARVGAKTLRIFLPEAVSAEGIAQQGTVPQATNIVQTLSAPTPDNTSAQVQLQTPAFGFFVVTPNPHTVTIRFYHDPLGARWQPSGSLAPATAAVAFQKTPRAVVQRTTVPAASPQAAFAPSTATSVTAPAPTPVGAFTPVAPVVPPASAMGTTKSAPAAVGGVSVSAQAASVPAPVVVQSPVRAPVAAHLLPRHTVPVTTPLGGAAPSADMGAASATALPVLQQDTVATAASDAAGSVAQAVQMPVHEEASTPDPVIAPAMPDALSATTEELPELSANASLGSGLISAPVAPVGLEPPVGEAVPASFRGKVGVSTPEQDSYLVSMFAFLASRAHAAGPEDGAAAGAQAKRSRVVTPQEIRSPVNTGGPEAWPEGEGIDSQESAPQDTLGANADLGGGAVSRPVGGTTAGQVTGVSQDVPATAPVAESAPSVATPTDMGAVPTAAVSQPVAAQPQSAASDTGKQQGSDPAQGTSAAVSPAQPLTGKKGSVRGEIPATETAGTANANATAPVIYVDEKGKVVPKPPEPDKMLADAEKLLETNQFTEALALLEEIKKLTIPAAMREKVLYLVSDATAAIYAGKPVEGLDPIVRTTSEAMNANMRAARVPDALSRLGQAYLRVGNLLEAEGYFKALRRRYPGELNVPEAFTSLGLAQLEKKLYPQASATFRMVLQEYPETSVLREASAGLVRSLVYEKKYQEAEVIADFVEKRWPRYYLNVDEYLRLSAELSLHLGRPEDALQQYWLYYNLDPKRENNEKVLGAIGDIYLQTKRIKPAREIFTEIRKRYPDTMSAAIATVRLAENSIHDSPITVQEMDRVFEAPGEPIPPAAYKEVADKWTESPVGQLSRLKLSMWQLWDKQYTEAMGSAADFIDRFPEHKDVEQARNVIVDAFKAELKNSLAEENYGRILSLWNGFPLVRQRYGPLDDVMRNALARGYLERGNEQKAMELFAEFLKTPKHPLYSDPTFALYFNRYLQEGNWNALLDLGELVKDWEMTPEMRRQVDYAMALAAENLGLAPRALALWSKLAQDAQVPLYQRAYANYFLARDAEQRRDIRDAYTYNKKTLEMFTQLEQARSDKSDPARIKRAIGSLMDITEVANRIPEALEWVDRYNAFVPQDSPEYPGLRFREARLYRKLGNTAKARSLLEHIVQKNPDSPFAKAAEMELRTFEVSRDLQNFMPPSQ